MIFVSFDQPMLYTRRDCNSIFLRWCQNEKLLPSESNE